MTCPSVQQVHEAAKACGRNKRRRPDAIAFRVRYGEEVIALTERLQSGQYHPEPGVRFVTDRPKNREIHAAHFRDRVVHHLLYDLLEPKWEPSFIADSYACRKGKGTLAAVNALQNKMRCITRNYQIAAYALQLDIKSFFPSLHKPTLWKLLEPRFKEGEELLRLLTWKNVMHRSEQSAVSRGSSQLFARIPLHKTLGARGPDCGLPIGNLTSQFFANVYLNALDHFVKRALGVRHYVRYVDDFVLLHTDKQQLLEWEQAIRVFLAERLSLEAHDAKVLSVSLKGVDFLGYVVRPNYSLVRSRVVTQARKRIAEKERAVLSFQNAEWGIQQNPKMRLWPIPSEAIEELRATWSSYLGHCSHADGRRVVEALWNDHPVSRFYLQGMEFPKKGYGLRPRFCRDSLDASWSDQIRRLRHGIGDAILLVQVGRYMQVPLRKDISALKLRTVRMKNGTLRAGVPFSYSLALIGKCIGNKRPTVVALEVPGSTGPVKPRFLAYFIEPVEDAGMSPVVMEKRNEEK